MGRNNQARRKEKKAAKEAKQKTRRHLPVVQAVRACDGCTVCCTVFGVDEINKAPWEGCVNLNERGCGIYETRPGHCRGFYCMWQHGLATMADRPDKLGVVFAPTDGKTTFTGEEEVQAYEVVPGAFDNPHAIRIAKTFSDRGLLVIGHVYGGKKLRFAGPPAKIAKGQRWAMSLNKDEE